MDLGSQSRWSSSGVKTVRHIEGTDHLLHKANCILGEQRFLTLFTYEGGNIIDLVKS
jgi:hypothetical protein